MVTGLHSHDFIRLDSLVGMAAVHGEQLISVGRQLDAAQNLRAGKVFAVSVHSTLAIVDVKNALTDRVSVVSAVFTATLFLHGRSHGLPLPEWASEYSFPRMGFV